MLALIAGTGGLPVALVRSLKKRPLICALDGFVPDLHVDVGFRIEHLGSFLEALTQRGITQVCFAGAIDRPRVDARQIDAATAPLAPRIAQAIAQGDDAALRIIIAIFEEAGFVVVGADQIAANLLPPTGVLTRTVPADRHTADAIVGEACVAALGQSDTGQSCIVRQGRVIATEGPDGTAAMIGRFHAPEGTDKMTGDPVTAVIDFASDLVGQAADWLSGSENGATVTSADGILFKAPKPGQDRRADLPLIGPDTAMQAAEAGLAGIVIEAGGVMILDLPAVCEILDAQGMFVWVRPRGAP